MKDLDVHPARGASWETFIVEEVISAVHSERTAAEVYFWRTATGQEVDLLVRIGNRLVPIEIKLQSAPRSEDGLAVRRCMHDLGCRRGYVVYPGTDDYSLGGGVTALSASRLLAKPQRVIQL
jgi:predicted AAA+ superfamily ATPase